MIPKIIHYCWFGGKPLPDKVKEYIETWKKNLPGYSIKQWDESNFDLESSPIYVKQALERKKWAYVTDFVRLNALVNEGGIYLDTDVEVLSSFDKFLEHEAFSCFENEVEVSTAILGCEKGHPLFKEFLETYYDRKFILDDGTMDLTTNVVILTGLCKKYGLVSNNNLQTVGGLTVYPKEYFSPKSYETGEIHKTKNTVAIHNFAGTWQSKEYAISFAIKQKLNKYGTIGRLTGIVIAFPFTFIDHVKFAGWSNSIKYYLGRASGKQ